MKGLLLEQYKNLRIILRKWDSLALLILGPLVLIAIIGFAYSGEGIHDVSIGVIGPRLDDAALQNFSAYAMITYYDTEISCAQAIKSSEVHICLHFLFSENSSSTIVFTFDNSKKALSNKLVESLSSYFGAEAQKISLDSARTIFGNIQNLVVYLYDKNQDIGAVIDESISIRFSLVERKAKLIELRDQYSPIYEESKLLNKALQNVSRSVNSSYTTNSLLTEDLDKRIISLQASLSRISDPLYLLNDSGSYSLSLNYTALNSSYLLSNGSLFFPSYNLSIESGMLDEETVMLVLVNELNASLSDLGNALDRYSRFSSLYYNDSVELKQRFDVALGLMGQIYELLNTEINTTELYIEKLDKATITMTGIQTDMNSSLQDLGQLSPDIAERLIKPIIMSNEPLMPGLPNIKAAFPGMLAIIIIFISLLLSNIVTLSEINSKAFYRNLLAPVNSLRYVLGLLVTVIILVICQISVLLLVARYRFFIPIEDYLFPLFITVIVLSLVFIVLGMIIAILIREEQTSVLTTTFSALGFFLFSDAVTPLETMPPLASIIASANPFVLGSSVFRALLVYGNTDLGREFIYMLCYLGFLVLTLILISKQKLK